MRREVFNEIVQANMNNSLVSVTLSGGVKIAQALEIDGNRTTRTSISFVKIEETYVAIRKHIDVSYDYSGSSRKGDATNNDYYLGYEEIVAIEFYDDFATQIEQQERRDEEKRKSREREAERKKAEIKAQAVRAEAQKDKLFVETAGDI